MINVVTRQGSARFRYDASYYGQSPALTSRPVLLPLDPAQPESGESGYERVRYRDFTTSVGGPVVRDRLWFFTGYQYLRDYDSQPASDPAHRRLHQGRGSGRIPRRGIRFPRRLPPRERGPTPARHRQHV